MNAKLLLVCVALLVQGCSKSLTPEEVKTVAALQAELVAVRADIELAKTDDAKVAGGLLKALISARLEVLKTNEALIQQRVHVIEGRTKTDLIVTKTTVNPQRVAEVEQELGAQRKKLADARTEADRYSGGLIKTMFEATVATAATTVAMLEQQRVIAKFGLALPDAPSKSPFSEAPPAQSSKPTSSMAPAAAALPTVASTAKECLKINTFDSSALSSNSTYTEMAWKVDVANSCSDSFDVKVIFKLYDKDDFELDTDSEALRIEGNSVGKARGKMLVSPPEKARRMARQGVSLRY